MKTFRVVFKREATIEAESKGHANQVARLFFGIEEEDEEQQAEDLPCNLHSGPASGTATTYTSRLTVKEKAIALAAPTERKEP